MPSERHGHRHRSRGGAAIERQPASVGDQRTDADPLARMPDLAVETGIRDLATNIDHYLYGLPKARATEAVFLGGSRRISRLNDGVRSKLDSLLDRGLWFFVGDANGADRALQQHLSDRGCERVVVYAVTGSLRNNIGHWKVCLVDPPRGARGFELYSAKDKRMASDASYGFMLWDGTSRETLENVRSLLAQRKPVAVYLGPTRRFVSLKSAEDLPKLGQA